MSSGDGAGWSITIARRCERRCRTYSLQWRNLHGGRKSESESESRDLALFPFLAVQARRFGRDLYSTGPCSLSLRRDNRKEKKRQCLSCKGESIFRSTPRRSQLQIRHLVFVPKKSRRQPIRNDPWRHARTVRSRSSARVDSDHRVGPSRQDRCKKGKNELRRALTSAQPVWWSPRSTGSKKDIGSAD